MKKVIITFLTLVFFIFITCSCVNNTTFGVSEGTYALKQNTDEIMPPKISFDLSDNTFIFTYDYFSSYLTIGKIKIEDGKITAKTDDGKYKYIFEIVDNDTIRFIQNGPSKIIMTDKNALPSVVNGSEFFFRE